MQLFLFSFANSFLKFMSPALLNGGNDWEDYVEQDWVKNILKPIMSLLETLVPILLILVGTAGSIYAIILGVNYSRAETSDKREEAKKRLVNAIVGLVVMILLLALLFIFSSNIGSIVTWLNQL